MNDKISVIIPIYNMERLLERALESVVAQSYKNLEILLIDDGSTDKSREICKKYESKDSRFRYYYQKNNGVSSARNLGVEKSTGNFITFLDPDDYLDYNIYECLLKVLNESHADLVMCDYRVVYDYEKHGEITQYDVEILDRYQAQERYFKGTHEATQTSVLWNKLIPASFIKDLKFPVGRIQEDESVSYKILYRANCVAYLNAPFYNYYVRPDGWMNREFNLSRFNLFQAYLERMEFYIEHQEYELCKKLFFLYMHMICQYRKWMKQSKEAFSDIYNLYLRQVRSKYKEYKSKLNLSKRELMECELFYRTPSLYYVAWGILKKHN